MKNKQRIGGIIKNYRINKNYTQQYVSNKIGIDTSNYSKIERGLINPTINILSDICVILNIDPFILLGLNKIGDKIIKKI